MIKYFLKAKHWQLFLITFGIPFTLQIVMMVSIFSNFQINTNPDPLIFLNYMKFYPLIMIISITISFAWFWSVAIGLQGKIPLDVKMKVKKFKIFFFSPFVYFLIFMVFFYIGSNNLFNINQDATFRSIGLIFAIVLPLHLFSMFCMLYILYFTAKTIKTVELQKEVKFADFVGEFFLIWFYPIGIWIIQPKLNKLISEN